MYLLKRLPMLLLGALLLTAATGNAQILDRIERKVKNRVDRKVDRTIDKGLDKAEEGIDSASKGNKKPEPSTAKTEPSTGGSKTADTGGEMKTVTLPATSTTVVTSVNTKFDFVPGERVLFADDLSADPLGDFPARWNTSGSGEIVTLSGQSGKWLKIPDNTVTFPETNMVLPENFTIEFDLLYPAGSTRPPVTFGFAENSNPVKNKLNTKKILYFRIDNARNLLGISHNSYSGHEDNKEYPVNNMADKNIRVSISVSKARIRLYMGQDKIFDLPRAFDPATLRNNFHFRAAQISPAAKQPFYIANLRIAEGGSDLRSKLLAEGKVSTTGILFDVNAASIKPQSYGIIHEVATAMQENATMRLKIIGHTDNDGPDKSNLDLSQRRAEAVKKALKEQYGIDAGRLESEGKGESQPVADNNSAAAKAKNRRVEFVKMN